MAMTANQIQTMIETALPDATVTIEDLRGDGEHYAATVICPSFEGMPRVRQHQAVYTALQGKMGDDLHALQLKTSAS